MLGIRVIFPTSVFQGMALRGAGADVRITDAAMLFHGVLRTNILLIEYLSEIELKTKKPPTRQTYR